MAIDKRYLEPGVTIPDQPPGSKIEHINAYEVTRHYGGPEEGGWWFDAGTPLASIPVLIPPDGTPQHQQATADMVVDSMKRYLLMVLGPQYMARRDRYSVIGEEDLMIIVEDHMAQPWPTEVPHYE